MNEKKKGIFLFIIAGVFVLICGSMLEYSTARAIENSPNISMIIDEIKLPSVQTSEIHYKKATDISVPVPIITETNLGIDNVEEQNEIPAQEPHETSAQEDIRNESIIGAQNPDDNVKKDEDKRAFVQRYDVDHNAYAINFSAADKGDVFNCFNGIYGSTGTIMHISVIEGDYGFCVIASNTGEVVADNSEAAQRQVDVVCVANTSYYIRVNSVNGYKDIGRIYIYS